MMKKITLIILLFCAIISCGKKGDPEWKDDKNNILINKV